MSGHALLEPSAQMNTDCSIYRGMSGNGPTAALFGNRLTQAASLLVLRRPIVGASRRRRTPHLRAGLRSGRERGRLRCRQASEQFGFVWFARTTALQQSLLCCDDWCPTIDLLTLSGSAFLTLIRLDVVHACCFRAVGVRREGSLVQLFIRAPTECLGFLVAGGGQ